MKSNGKPPRIEELKMMARVYDKILRALSELTTDDQTEILEDCLKFVRESTGKPSEN